MSKKSNRFSPVVRERAVRMVQDDRGAYQTLWADLETLIAPYASVGKKSLAPVAISVQLRIHVLQLNP